jgi:hypothetical protein
MDINDSFKIFKEAGIQCIRFPLYWECYEKNPEAFNQELDNISSAAWKYDILLCIYDNHQWECSSYIGEGSGFPNSLLIGSFEPHSDPSSRPSRQDLKKILERMVGSKIRDYRRKRWLGSTIKFLEGVIKRLKDKYSTLGFEILNEPQVFRQVDFRK